MTFYVDAGGNDVSGDGTAAAPFLTMDKALSAVSAAYDSTWPGYPGAPAAARILVGGAITAGDGASTSALFDIIDTGLYIALPPVILGGKTADESANKLDGGNSRRVLYIENVRVALEAGLTLTGGNPGNGDGGGVYVDDGSFAMSGGTISGNTAAGTYGRGGGVYVDGGSFAMSGGTISGNSATGYNGIGGGVVVSSGSFTMSGGTISGNTTTSSNGGGVHFSSSGSFIKSGGTVYGDTKEGGGPEDPPLKNTAGSGNGHAAYVSSTKYRNKTAGPGVSLDSGTGTNWGL
jgi:hypothetical protein